MEKKIDLQIEGMSCSHCVNSVSRLLSGNGIIHAEVSLEKKLASIIFDDEKTDQEKITEMVNNSGIYQATCFNEQ